MDLNVYRQTPEALFGITYIGCWSVTCQAVSARRPPEVCIREPAIRVNESGFGSLGSLDDALDLSRLARPVRARRISMLLAGPSIA